MLELNLKIPIKEVNKIITPDVYYIDLHNSLYIAGIIINKITEFSSVLRLFTNYSKLFDEDKSNILLKFKITFHSGSMLDEDYIFLRREIRILIDDLKLIHKNQFTLENDIISFNK